LLVAPSSSFDDDDEEAVCFKRKAPAAMEPTAAGWEAGKVCAASPQSQPKVEQSTGAKMAGRRN